MKKQIIETTKMQRNRKTKKSLTKNNTVPAGK